MKLSASDAAVAALAVLGSCVLMYLFIEDVGSAAVRSADQPLGTVVFRKLSATRRSASGLGWERMRNNDPVYSADTLRTAAFSEAALYFDDGTNLDLQESTMLKLDFGGPTRNLEFLYGELSVSHSSGSSSYTVSSAAGTIHVGAQASATFSRTADTLSVEVSKGEASLVKADGSTETIGADQELAVNVKSGESSLVSRPLIPLEPDRNARFLSTATGGVLLRFRWRSGDAGGAAAGPFTLELSQSKRFDTGRKAYSTTETQADAELEPGTWYWRVRDGAGGESAVRKFTLAAATPPRPAYPNDGQEYRYRRAAPDIRFAWTAMDAAAAYIFELAADAGFGEVKLRSRVSGTHLSVTDLQEGLWFWRVTPVHAFQEVGPPREQPVRRVIVARSGEMPAPEATMPFDESLYRVQEVDGKGLSFSWLPRSEAVSYELLIAKTEDMAAPLVTAESRLPYMSLSGERCAPLRESGTYYWTVRWVDNEGNRSPPGAPRTLRGVDGSLGIRAVFPPEAYRIADSLTTNTRFTWKTTIPARTVFLVARDRDFKDLVHQETSDAETVMGRSWPRGTYFWKLRTYNADGSVFMETEARSFVVVEPFDGPVLETPAPGSSFFLREKDTQKISWRAVAGADHYSVKIYAPYADRPIYERSLFGGLGLEFPLGDYPGGTYRVSVQAFGAEKESSTRIIGYIGDTYFSYDRLGYLQPAAPADGSVFGGLAARRGGVDLRYESKNRPAVSEFLVSRDSGGRDVVVRRPGSGGTTKLRGLAAGTYFWTVLGSLADFDISARERYSFTIEPVPALPPVRLLTPEQGFVFGPEELRRRRAIPLGWEGAAGATHYRLTLRKKDDAEPVLRIDRWSRTEFLLEELSRLDRGEFVWEVEALSYDDEGELEQEGTPVRSAFLIELPRMEKPSAKTAGSLYGR